MKIQLKKNQYNKFKKGEIVHPTKKLSLLSPNLQESAKAEINKQHEIFYKAAEFSSNPLLILDKTGSIEYSNPAFLKITGFCSEEIHYKKISALKGKNPSVENSGLEKALSAGKEWEGDFVISDAKGDNIHVTSKLSPVENEQGEINNFVWSGDCITPVSLQKQLDKTIKEKDILLAELHHRVKNNLAIISGLMQIQAMNEEDKSVRNKLHMSSGRIKSMASMHELLYKAESLNHIEFGQIIQEVVQIVSVMHDPQNKIKVFTKLDDVQLNINQAHPSTLIVYEIISNTYIHAFENHQEGSIKIILKDGEGEVHLQIEDNGMGFSEDYVTLGKQKKTTGYEVLNALVNQLRGTYKYQSENSGTRFSLSFEKENKNGTQNGLSK